MDKLIDRAPFGDLLGILAPGLIFLSGCGVVWTGDIVSLFREVVRESFVAGFTYLMGAYLVGVLLNELANAGTRYFIHLHMCRAAQQNSRGISVAPHRIAYLLTAALFWIRLPRFDRSLVELLVVISESIEAASQLFGSARISSPWDRLELFRILASRTVPAESIRVLEAAEHTHARLMFVLSLSVTSSLLGVAATGKFAVAIFSRVPCLQFAVSAFAGIGISYLLRLTAARLWEQELLLISSLRSSGTARPD